MSFASVLSSIRHHAGSPAALLRTYRAWRDRHIVERSPLFDGEWYLREHPEVAPSGVNTGYHYILTGHPAGLDPSPGFCGAEYAALHRLPDDVNPLVHFERVGRRKGLRRDYLQPDGDADWRFPSVAEHQSAMAETAAAIGARMRRGERVRAVFLVASTSMFPARPLLDALRRDERFDARICVIPDLRGIGGGDPRSAMDACRAELGSAYPAETFLEARRGPDGLWNDVLSDFRADIVCHPSPYDLSAFPYNPRWCVGRPFLPVHVNYGYFRSAYDRHLMETRNYALFWKAFFECPETLAEYRGHSVLRGANAEVVGYVKMDALAGFPVRTAGGRKRVLVCPHHSVAGGANDSLSLSNFLRHADLLASLPERFPEIDFVFRPHPFLFPVLMRRDIWTAKRCDAWRRRFLAHSNAFWNEGGDYLREFAAADAIVQDCGSYLVEWMYTGRPCCYMLRSEADFAKFAPLGRDCLRACHLAYDAEAILAFLREVVVGGRDGLAEARQALRTRVAVNYPHAAEAALEAIVRGLSAGCS